MSKAPEQELSELHGLLAQVMKGQLSETITMTNEDGEETVVHTATPALLAQVSKFLKDNNVTASVEDDENLKGLAEALAEKRKKRGLRLVAGSEPE